MKKLSQTINEASNTINAAVNEASNPLVKSIDSLFKRIGLKQLKLKVPDSITEPVVIGSLMMDPTDAGMLQSCFKEMNISVTLIKLTRIDAFRLVLDYKWKHPTGGTNGLTIIYTSIDAGKSWHDENNYIV